MERWHNSPRTITRERVWERKDSTMTRKDEFETETETGTAKLNHQQSKLNWSRERNRMKETQWSKIVFGFRILNFFFGFCFDLLSSSCSLFSRMHLSIKPLSIIVHSYHLSYARNFFSPHYMNDGPSINMTITLELHCKILDCKVAILL